MASSEVPAEFQRLLEEKNNRIQELEIQVKVLQEALLQSSSASPQQGVGVGGHCNNIDDGQEERKGGANNSKNIFSPETAACRITGFFRGIKDRRYVRALGKEVACYLDTQQEKEQQEEGNTTSNVDQLGVAACKITAFFRGVEDRRRVEERKGALRNYLDLQRQAEEQDQQEGYVTTPAPVLVPGTDADVAISEASPQSCLSPSPPPPRKNPYESPSARGGRMGAHSANTDRPKPPPVKSNGHAGRRATTNTFSPARAVSIDSADLSGSVLDDSEMWRQFHQVCGNPPGGSSPNCVVEGGGNIPNSNDRAGTVADRDAVVQYVQARYEDLGDPRRFHRLMDTVVDRGGGRPSAPRRSSVTYDEFCVILLRLAAA